MSITTSVYTSFGYGLGKFGPAGVLFRPVVLAGQLPVALIIAELGSRIPLTGYSYQWGSRMVNTGVRLERQQAGHRLAAIGIDPEQIAHVVVTHLHYDHCGGLSLLPNATVHAQAAERRFAEHPPCTRRPPTFPMTGPGRSAGTRSPVSTTCSAMAR